MRSREGLKALVAACILVCLPTVAAAHGRSFEVGAWGRVDFELPADWTTKMKKDAGSGVVSIRFLPPNESGPMSILATPLALPIDWDDPEKRVEELAEQVIRPGLSEIALEADLRPRRLEGPGSVGLYYSVTDRTVTTPTSENFKYGMQGVVIVGRLFVTFTVLANDRSVPAWKDALEVIRSARYGFPGPPWRTPAGGYALAYPWKDWRLALDLPRFEVSPIEWRSRVEAVRLEGRNRISGVFITVFLEEAPADRSAVEQREWAWERIKKSVPGEYTDVERSERRGMAILEYTCPDYGNETVLRRHVNAHLVRDGIWIDVHLSKAEFREDDQQLFEAVLDSVRIEE